MGMYIIFLYCGNSVMSLISGYVVQGNILPSKLLLFLSSLLFRRSRMALVLLAVRNHLGSQFSRHILICS
jgi:hypothetical protein